MARCYLLFRPDFEETRHYLGGIEFVDGEPDSYNFGDGRIVWIPVVDSITQDTVKVPQPQFRLHDHLGNTVVYFHDKNNDGCITTEADTNDPDSLEIIQRFWYYPFGMAMQGLRDWATEPGQWYRYNGKERDTVSGWYDYGARWYIDEIGRWNGVDPLADWAPGWTPFRYGFNNPVLFIDPDGLFETKKKANKARTKSSKEFGKDNVGNIYFDKDKKEYGFKIFKEHTGTLEDDGVVTIKGDKGTSIFNKKDINDFKSANGLHDQKYWNFSLSFVVAGGASFSLGRVYDKYGDKAWYSTVGGGVGLELGLGFDEGYIIEHEKDFRVEDFQGQGIDYGLSVGRFGFRIGGNDPNQDRLLYKGRTYTTLGGSVMTPAPKPLNRKVGGSYLWTTTKVY